LEVPSSSRRRPRPRRTGRPSRSRSKWKAVQGPYGGCTGAVRGPYGAVRGPYGGRTGAVCDAPSGARVPPPPPSPPPAHRGSLGPPPPAPQQPRAGRGRVRHAGRSRKGHTCAARKGRALGKPMRMMMHVSSLKRSRRRSPRVPPTVYPQK
jgi:hypothetical protein